jgi:hypothetical protein
MTTNGDLEQVRERVAEALLMLSSVGFGDTSVQLRVDVKSRLCCRERAKQRLSA